MKNTPKQRTPTKSGRGRGAKMTSPKGKRGNEGAHQVSSHSPHLFFFLLSSLLLFFSFLFSFFSSPFFLFVIITNTKLADHGEHG